MTEDTAYDVVRRAALNPMILRRSPIDKNGQPRLVVPPRDICLCGCRSVGGHEGDPPIGRCLIHPDCEAFRLDPKHFRVPTKELHDLMEAQRKRPEPKPPPHVGDGFFKNGRPTARGLRFRRR